jgi:hypothetical protein
MGKLWQAHPPAPHLCADIPEILGSSFYVVFDQGCPVGELRSCRCSRLTAFSHLCCHLRNEGGVSVVSDRIRQRPRAEVDSSFADIQVAHQTGDLGLPRTDGIQRLSMLLGELGAALVSGNGLPKDSLWLSHVKRKLAVHPARSQQRIHHAAREQLDLRRADQPKQGVPRTIGSKRAHVAVGFSRA